MIAMRIITSEIGGVSPSVAILAHEGGMLGVVTKASNLLEYSESHNFAVKQEAFSS